ncbi:MAG TPA: glycosyl hydrolase family 28 protein [Tepidisphaeraceae bacterium]|nr:glycosyl hydrolase family 28 protein [Tepidisphaeraceae bacterium]
MTLGTASSAAAESRVHVVPAPVGAPLSKDFSVRVEGADVPVYLARVAPGDDARRWKAMDDAARSGDYADHASFTPFDMSGPVNVRIECPEAIKTVRVLPTSWHIEPMIDGKTIELSLTEPRNVTVEVNGDWVHSLHLFASPMETDVPKEGDSNVLYFGPGVHEVREGIKVGDGKTLYIASGAILRGIGSSGGPVVSLTGDHVTLRGRGIIDGSQCPTHTRNLLAVRGKDIKIDGVILHDSSTWNVPMRRCDRVSVTNLKILGCRANSDGIDVCNSRDVTIDGCFIRTLDDLVVIKSDKGQGEVHHVLVKNCVLWNQVAHALSVGAELRENVDDVTFENCDVIHDIGREWTLRVYHCDAALVSNIRFQDIRIEESRRLISVWIGKQVWSRDAERGHVTDVLFKDIQATSKTPVKIELQGFDAGHEVVGVKFENVVVNGMPLVPAQVKANEFVGPVVVK